MITPLHKWISDRIGVSLAEFDRQHLEQWQLARLKWLIDYARQKSPLYRTLFGNCSPLDSLHEFSGYPFTNSENLLENPASFVCVSQEEVHRIVSLPTSGTTDRSKRVFFSQADQALTIDFFRVGMSSLAVKGDRVLILLPAERPGGVGDLLFIGLTVLGCVPFKYGPVDDEERVLRLIRDEKINILVGAPVHLYRLACYDEINSMLLQGQIRAVLVSTDVLPTILSERLKENWGCEVFDHYGMTETGLGGGVECGAHDGYHMREADLYIEIIDPDTGEILRDGVEGEVVITTLTRDAMPLIRYRTGDISRVIPGTCDCGSFIKRLARIKKRWRSGVRIGKIVLNQNDLDEALFAIRGVCDFQALVDSDERGRDVLIISLRVLGKDFCDARTGALKSLLNLPGITELVECEKIKIQIVEMDTTTNTQKPLFSKRKIEDLRTPANFAAQASR